MNPPSATSASPRLLLIETSGKRGQVGLALGEALLQQAELNPDQRNARDLMPTIAHLCFAQGWKPVDLEGVVVSAGPGSYTGLRVGMMTAKTLAYARQIPLFTIPTHEAIAWHACQLQPGLPRLDVLSDAQQNRLYLQRFSMAPPTLQEEKATRLQAGPLELLTVSRWRETLQAGTGVTGPALSRQAATLSAELPAGVQLLPEAAWHPELSGLAALGLDCYRANHQADVLAVEPIYLRASSAEEQWAALGK